MRKDRIVLPLISLTILLICVNVSCGRHWVRTGEKSADDTLSFSELPGHVVKAYENYFERGTRYSRYIVTDSSKVHVEELIVINPDFPRLGWKYGFYFIINGKKMFISYYPVKGEPYVIDEEYVYWSTDLNIRVQNYQKITYVRKRWKSM